MTEILKILFEGRSLERSQAARAMDLLMDGKVVPEQVAAFLGALRAKKETVDEIVGFAQSIRKHALPLFIKNQDELVDTCGTGGDGSQSFNISTTVAFVLAGAGLPVAKHGNRSVSSLCGSADVLEALGVKCDLEPSRVARSVEENGFGFMFAPLFHPAMKSVGPVRKALGVRTVFNILGPLSNPAFVKKQVLGVYDRALLDLMAGSLRELGVQSALVVAGGDGLDEFTLSGESHVAQLLNGEIKKYTVLPEDVGLKRAPQSALLGGDARTNAGIIEDILKGAQGPKRDVVLYNAGAAFFVSSKASTLREGISQAASSIGSGRAFEVLQKLRKFA